MLRAARAGDRPAVLAACVELVASGASDRPDVLKNILTVIDQILPVGEPVDSVVDIFVRQTSVHARLALAGLLGKHQRLEEATRLCQSILGTDAGHAQANLMMAGIFTAQKNVVDAIASYEKALASGVVSEVVYYNLGLLYSSTGADDAAIHCYRQAIDTRPDFSAARNNLAVVLSRAGDEMGAETEYHAGLQHTPDEPGMVSGLALLLIRTGREADARPLLERLLEQGAGQPEAYRALSGIHERLGSSVEARKVLDAGLVRYPDDVGLVCQMGHTLSAQRQSDAAEQQFRLALSRDQNCADAWFGLANLFQARGQYAEAESYHRRALENEPEHQSAWSNLLMLLNYCCADDRARAYETHCEWARCRHPVRERAEHARYHHDRIRVGYVSADFFEHAVMSFLMPVLEHHDRSQYDIYCYSDASRSDATTAKIQALDLNFLNVRGLTARQLADRVAADEIDILVDLTGHTANHRLACFALEPAPAQLSWLGYPNTTGLEQMGYRLSDVIADQEDADQYHSERLLRTDAPFLCFRPMRDVGVAPEPPCLHSGAISFGSFNTLAKITPTVIALWTRVLSRVENSRLLMKCVAFQDEAVIETTRSRFIEAGLNPDRLALVRPEASYEQHLERYREVDIALDCFPYNGTTTTCEALWMGVPVVTKTGQAHAARVGASVLTSAGFPDLIASDEDRYIEIAVALAEDADRLTEFRRTAREHLLNSPLCDEPGFVEKFESVLREISSG